MGLMSNGVEHFVAKRVAIWIAAQCWNISGTLLITHTSHLEGPV